MERKKTEKLDVIKYVGTKTKIAKAQYQNAKHGAILFLQTEKIELLGDDTLPENVDLTGTLLLSFMEDKEGLIYIGEDTKLDKFLKAKEIDTESMPEFEPLLDVGTFIGKDVIVQKNDRGFLQIA